MKTGLTLGKYAPLHKGHEYVINTALKEMDHVIAVIYNASDVTDIPTHIRADWIRNTFPEVEVIIAEDGPQDVGYTSEIIEKQNDYLQKILKGRNIDAFYSSEKYGKFVSDALCCTNRVIDLERKVFPITASAIRKNVKDTKNLVSKCVYNTIINKFYFVGAPSTGKTTISSYCAEKLQGSYCKEYGRDYWFQHQKKHRLSMYDLETIAIKHNELETDVSEKNTDYLFIDTCVITTFAYSIYYFNEPSKKLKKIFEESLYKYKNVFLCNDDIPFDDTWDRSGPASREIIQKINMEILNDYNIPYLLLSGSVPERFEYVKKYIQKNKL